MNAIEITALIAAIGYAIYKQTHRAEVRGAGRFTLAGIYGAVGIAVGGFVAPSGATAVVLLTTSILLSVIIGVARGRLTRIEIEPDGRVFRQGTALTVGLFLGLIAVKVGMGTFAWFEHLPESGGFGEIMVMMAVMVAAQAEILHRRAQALVRSSQRELAAV
jgi:hypothetical protein